MLPLEYVHSVLIEDSKCIRFAAVYFQHDIVEGFKALSHLQQSLATHLVTVQRLEQVVTTQSEDLCRQEALLQSQQAAVLHLDETVAQQRISVHNTMNDFDARLLHQQECIHRQQIDLEVCRRLVLFCCCCNLITRILFVVEELHHSYIHMYHIAPFFYSRDCFRHVYV